MNIGVPQTRAVAVNGTLGWKDTARLIAELETGDSRQVLWDLGDVTFVAPLALASLAAVLNTATLSRNLEAMKWPRNTDCYNYLSTTGFLDAVPARLLPHHQRHVAKPTTAQTVLALTALRRSDDIIGATDSLEKGLERVAKAGAAAGGVVTGPVRTVVKEICQNIFDHSGVSQGWVAAQRYSRADGTARVEVGIADLGQGIPESIRAAHTQYADVAPTVILEEVIKRRLSSKQSPGSHGGTGYFALQEAVKTTGGWFTLLSGNGAYTDNGPTGRDVPGIGGTHLVASFRC